MARILDRNAYDACIMICNRLKNLKIYSNKEEPIPFYFFSFIHAYVHIYFFVSQFHSFYTTMKKQYDVMCVYIQGDRIKARPRFKIVVCWVFMNSEAPVGSIEVRISRLRPC